MVLGGLTLDQMYWEPVSLTMCQDSSRSNCTYNAHYGNLILMILMVPLVSLQDVTEDYNQVEWASLHSHTWHMAAPCMIQ